MIKIKTVNGVTVKTCNCTICGEETEMIGTKLCHRCWELKTRIDRDFDLSLKIIGLYVNNLKDQLNECITQKNTNKVGY